MDPQPGIHILGVNEVGQESGNALACEGRDIPWIQETLESQVWGPWEVVYRDVVILDADNQKIGVFNLTTESLSIPANYQALRTLLLNATAP